MNVLFKFILILSLIIGFTTSAQDKKAQNPIIYADVPDASMLRVGDTYYMSSTTMHMSPGLANYEIERFSELGTYQLWL